MDDGRLRRRKCSESWVGRDPKAPGTLLVSPGLGPGVGGSCSATGSVTQRWLQVFFQELLKEARSSKAFPEDVVRLIFSNISSIYQFHSQFFLPELQRWLDDW